MQIRKLVLLIWLVIPLFYLHPKAPGLLVAGRFPWEYFSLRIFAWFFFPPPMVCIKCKCIVFFFRISCWIYCYRDWFCLLHLWALALSKLYLYMWSRYGSLKKTNLWLEHTVKLDQSVIHWKYFSHCISTLYGASLGLLIFVWTQEQFGLCS